MTAKPLISMVFVPSSDERKLSKIPELPGAAMILDLEDAVATSVKPQARLNAAKAIDEYSGAKSLWVRVNTAETDMLEQDLDAVVRPGLKGIDLPKVESPEQLLIVSGMLDELERSRCIEPGSVRLIGTVETAKGVGAVDAVASAGTSRLYCLGFGTGDFCLDIGITTDPESPTVIAAKIDVVLASRRAGIMAPHDSVFINFRDAEGLEEDARLGKRLGFFGKHAIHPDQVEVIERVFLPGPEELDRARRLVDAFESAEREGRAAIDFEGELVDYPIAERYRQLVALAAPNGALRDG